MEEGMFSRVWTKVVIALAVLILLLPAGTQAATLSELLKKQAQLQQQEEQSRKAIEQKKREASNIKDAISNIDEDISYTSNRIRNTQEQISTTSSVLDALHADIVANQKKLEELNGKLSAAYANLYEMSQTSTIELVMQSDNLDDLLSQTQYIQAIQTSLQEDIEKANTLQAELDNKKKDTEAQKANLESLNQNLNSSKQSLSSQKSQKNTLLAQTQGEQAKYEALLAQIRNQASQISNEIYRARQAAGGFTSQGGTGGYPWAGNCDKADTWLFYTCQCTSYAAWKFLRIHGVPFNNTRPGSGSAYNWPNLARDQGYKVSSTPRVGAVVSWAGPLFPGDVWGHVAVVEAVYSSNDIVISEYNWSPAKKYSERRINPNNYGAPRYIYP